MNSFGRLFRISIFGESHGDCVGVLIDGVKPGINLTKEDFKADLARRKSGGLGTTPRVEADEPIIESGVLDGVTTGAPILIKFLNTNKSSKDYEQFGTHPRPGHADYVADLKYNGYNDLRGGGAFSGRLTLGIVAAGVIAKKMLADVKITSEITNLGGETDKSKFNDLLTKITEEKDSIGGIVTLRVDNPYECLGEPYFDSCESVISHLLFSIGGVKGVEFGIGFKGVNLKGSEFNDLIIDADGKTKTNNNGGINGGITNGNPLLINVFVKPTPSIGKPQQTFDFEAGEIKELIIPGRHDAAIILRAQVVLEAAVAIALCDLSLCDNAFNS